MNTIHISEFPGKNDMEILRAAVKHLTAHPGTTLMLDPRTYNLRDEVAVKLQQDVMLGVYTKDPEKKMFTYRFPYQIGLDFKGAEDVTLDGNGATLLFDGFMENISCQFCKNVTIKNLTVDLKRPAYSRGKIIQRGKLAGNTPYMDVDFGEITLLSPDMPTLRMICVDKEKGEITSVTWAVDVSCLGKGCYHFSLTEDFSGDEVYLTHTYHYRPSILIYEASNIQIDHVTIHGHCGMGIVGHRSHNIWLNHLCVVPRPGYAVSTNTDATHFTSCTGYLRYTDCVFNGHGDDALNVHTYYHSLVKKEGRQYTLEVKSPTGTHCSKLDYFRIGDHIELCRLKDLAPMGIFTVKSVVPNLSDYTQTVEFVEQLPELECGVLFADIDQLPRLEFVNCTVKNHLARAVLVKTRNALIEGNVLDCRSWIGIHIAAEAHWHEGVGAANVVIRNNDILHYNTGILVEIEAEDPVLPIHKNILIENNRIQSGNGTSPIIVKCAEHITIRENQLCSQTHSIPVENSRDVLITDNVFVDKLF